MTTIDTPVLTPLGRTTQGTTAGQTAGWTAATAGGDLVRLTGRGVVLRMKTGATAVTWTIDSVAPSNYGTDQNMTVPLAANDEQEVYLATDGRWDQGGANAGYAKVTPSVTTDTPQIAVKAVP